MISFLLERMRIKKQETVLGVEFDTASLSAVKLDKASNGYSLVNYYSDTFPPEAYFEGHLTSDCVGNIIAEIIAVNKLGRFTKLGFTSYNDIDVVREEIICDKKALEIIEKQGVIFYIVEHFLKKKYPDDYMEVAFDYYDDISEKGILTVYYISDIDKINQLRDIAARAKKALSVCTLDKLSIVNFVNELFLSEISKNKTDSVFLGLYTDKLSICSFSSSGELKSYETVKIYNTEISDINYTDEAIQLLLRFIDFMSLDMSDHDFDSFENLEDTHVYVYGLKQNFESIFESIRELSQKQCEILNPFINIHHDSFDMIDQPYRYVIPVAIAMREAL
ncbi:type IV pili [Francisella sp. 19X1-34]|uniref:type IV pili n=1 Tax=Francisella sp. 19X1-34 TaxID=3087177 RepID=UPI002E32C848|nr:type IV pili [Francisella sp. 19X1-34]MED7788935.1 type IV pili [Francisella sp. 19X1-34]